MPKNRLRVLLCCAVMLVRCEDAASRVETVQTTTRTVTTTTRSVTPTERAYVGNVSTHRFHKLSCRYAGCPNCTARFATREEALAGGFRPCGICEP